MCVLVFVFVLRHLSFPSSGRGGRTQALSCVFKIEQTDITLWKSFLLPNLTQETDPNPEALSANKYLKPFTNIELLKR